jgi:hypothetical protein
MREANYIASTGAFLDHMSTVVSEIIQEEAKGSV